MKLRLCFALSVAINIALVGYFLFNNDILFFKSKYKRENIVKFVDSFKSMVRSRSYAEIYRNSSQDFKISTTQEKFVYAMEAIESEIGFPSTHEISSISPTYSSGGKKILLVRVNSEFSKKNVTEVFLLGTIQ